MYKGIVVQTTGGLHTVECNNKYYKCTLKGRMRKNKVESTNPVAVGDSVSFILSGEHTGVIEKIHDRKNCIIRRSSNLSKSKHIIASNISQALIFFTKKMPETTTVFLDRLLVAAESYDIKSVIIFNKYDLYEDPEKQAVKELINIYKKIGYKCLITSVTQKYNIELLKNQLKGNTSVVLGQSGTGKTSAINLIEPEANLKTGEISDYHKSGKHITTFAKMISLSSGGYIIDTPGIRGFGVVDIKKEEVFHFFPEFFQAASKCKYYNCTHIHEPGCNVLQLIDKGEISAQRYKSYLNIFYDGNDKHRLKHTGY